MDDSMNQASVFTRISLQGNALQAATRVLEIATTLSSQKDHMQMLQRILEGAMELTRAEAGTLYILDEPNQELHFAVVCNQRLHPGEVNIADPNWPAVPLYKPDGTLNRTNISACVALDRCMFNIEDAYTNTDFDFRGTRSYDQQTGYHSQAFLAIPLLDHEEQLIGVIQLINPIDEQGNIGRFEAVDEQLSGALASLAAMTLQRQRLIEHQQLLFETFTQLIAEAIDEKSSHTGEHCQKVPQIAMMLAEAINQTDQGVYGGQAFTEDEMTELRLAAWLHDCGKITTPDHVLDKSTKLQTIVDRIDVIRARFEILRRDAMLMHHAKGIEDEAVLREQLAEFDDELEFLARINIGAEFMTEEHQSRVRKIAQRSWRDCAGQEQPVITNNEVYNLCIERGTLNKEERVIIENHVRATISLLGKLPFPKHLQNIPMIAGGHHERLDGTGYPNGLKAEQLSLQARILAIADIFEALTASSRPYKEPWPLSRAFNIMEGMVEKGQIDGELLSFFKVQGIYRAYTEQYLQPRQLDMPV